MLFNSILLIPTNVQCTMIFIPGSLTSISKQVKLTDPMFHEQGHYSLPMLSDKILLSNCKEVLGHAHSSF